MKKILISAFLVVVVLVVAAAVIVFMSVDRIAKAGIERGGTYALGVPTTVDGANVGVFSGEFRMSGLNVANPEGFDGAHFLKLNDGEVAVSLGTLREETVELPRFALTGMDVILERRSGQANYSVILENVKRLESGEKPPEESGSEKRFIIREVAIRDVNVHVDLLPAGGKLTKVDVPIEEITLTDVGSGQDNKGVVLAELTAILVKAILAAIAENGGGLIPSDVLGSLQAGLANLEPLGDLGMKTVSDAADKLREQMAGSGDAMKGVGDDAGKALQDAGDKASEALKGVGGLLGGNKDK